MTEENLSRILHSRYHVYALPSPTAGIQYMWIVGCKNSHAVRRARRSLKKIFSVVWTKEAAR